MPESAARADGDSSAIGDGLSAGLSILAACAFGLAIVLDVAAATLFASLGLVLLAVSFGNTPRALSRLVSETRLAAALVSVALVAALVPDALNASSRSWLATIVPLMVVAFVVAQLIRGRSHSLVTGTTVILVALIAGMYSIHSVRGVGIDVVQLHRQAAVAIANGENPYGPAVSVSNGSPGAPAGSMIVGYPYPPVTALVFASSTWLWGDPRWASLISWTVLALCGFKLSRGTRRNHSSILPFLLLTALPGWVTMLQSGWTELPSAALIALAVGAWKLPVVSGIVLGAALGSKQYFIVVLPLIALYRDNGWRRRAVATLATAMLSLLPAFIWDASNAWRSLVLFHAKTQPRTDSSNLVGVFSLLGIHWNAPLWVGLGVSLASVTLVARRATGPAGFCRAMAIGLGTFFMLGSQAMPNYWFLVAAVAVLGSCSYDNGAGSRPITLVSMSGPGDNVAVGP